MIDRDIANLELRIRHAVGLVVWPVVGGVFGALIGVIFGFVVGGAVPLSLGVAIGAGFVALGTVAAARSASGPRSAPYVPVPGDTGPPDKRPRVRRLAPLRIINEGLAQPGPRSASLMAPKKPSTRILKSLNLASLR
ncbi:hypothetical protein ACFQY7_30330 [Actinomadura luteofluorescens]|uniref:hypothetical protein n=1 Tax=Actinomadura luteofluorescens TaxID=46163 RepID=UPI003629D165